MENQCYSVVTMVMGVRDLRNLVGILSCLYASAEACGYSVPGSFEAIKPQGKCAYCKHCQPCPAGLDFA